MPFVTTLSDMLRHTPYPIEHQHQHQFQNHQHQHQQQNQELSARKRRRNPDLAETTLAAGQTDGRPDVMQAAARKSTPFYGIKRARVQLDEDGATTSKPLAPPSPSSLQRAVATRPPATRSQTAPTQLSIYPRPLHHHHHQTDHWGFRQASPLPIAGAAALSAPSATEAPITTRLSPCYICHRRPTKKSDLDSFTQCQGCGGRTCPVCARACPGWESGQIDEQQARQRTIEQTQRGHGAGRDIAGGEQQQQPPPQEHEESMDGMEQEATPLPLPIRRPDGWKSAGHRSAVCSRCCVESGEDGDVVCLGCLEGV